MFSLQKSRFRIKNVRLRRPIWFPVSQDLLRINNYYDSVSFTSWTQLATQITNRDPRQSCFCVPVHSVEHFLLVFCFFLSRSIVCSFIWSFTKPREKKSRKKSQIDLTWMSYHPCFLKVFLNFQTCFRSSIPLWSWFTQTYAK